MRRWHWSRWRWPSPSRRQAEVDHLERDLGELRAEVIELKDMVAELGEVIRFMSGGDATCLYGLKVSNTVLRRSGRSEDLRIFQERGSWGD